MHFIDFLFKDSQMWVICVTKTEQAEIAINIFMLFNNISTYKDLDISVGRSRKSNNDESVSIVIALIKCRTQLSRSTTITTSLKKAANIFNTYRKLMTWNNVTNDEPLDTKRRRTKKKEKRKVFNISTQIFLRLFVIFDSTFTHRFRQD